MRIQAVQNNTSFTSRQTLKVYKNSLIDKNMQNNMNSKKCNAIVSGTLLGISACSLISVFTDGMKMLIPGLVTGISAILLNFINLSKNKHLK